MITAFIVNGDTYIVNPVEQRDPRIRVGQEGNLGSGTNNYWINFGNSVPTISLDKTADSSIFNPEDIVTYSFLVTNTSTYHTLFDVHVQDSTIGYATAANDFVTLAPGESHTFTATFQIPEDYSNEEFTNNATAYGTYGIKDLFETTISDTDTETVHVIIFTAEPAITLVKTADVSSGFVGDTVNYTLTVLNTGNVDLTGITLSDPALGLIDFGPFDLAQGESYVLDTGLSHVLTLDDLTAGEFVNNAKATVTFDEEVYEAADSYTVHVMGSPSISVSKQTDKNTYEVGENVLYTITVTNNGNVTLTDVSVNDPLLGGLLVNGITLDPGQTYTLLNIPYQVLLSDLFNGSIDNTVNVTGRFEEQSLNDSDSKSVTVIGTPGISVTKEADKTTYVEGDTITYTITVTNTGNIPLTGVTLNDALVGLNLNLGNLATGSSLTVLPKPQHVVTNSDVLNGSVINTVSVSGMAADSQKEVSDQADNEVTVLASPSLLVEKTANTDTGEVGTEITYSITVTNTGNVTLNNVMLSDEALGLTGDNAILIGTLTSGASFTVNPELKYTLTLEDLSSGSFVNTATATGNYGEQLIEDSDSATVSTEGTPKITIEKTADIASGTVGDLITFTITLENDGNVPLQNILVNDLGDQFGPYTLNPGETLVLSNQPTHQISIQDVINGSYTNEATVTGQYIDSEKEIDREVSDSDSATVNTFAVTGITIDKTVSSSSVLIGSTVTYTITVTNTGNVDLSQVQISDPMFGGNLLTTPLATLGAGESYQITGLNYTTAALGTLTNTATVTAWNFLNGEDQLQASDSASVTVNPEPPVITINNPGILVTISPDNTLVPLGTDVTFTIVVTNTGNTILNNVTLVNSELGINETLAGPLYVTQSQTLTVTKTMDTLETFTTSVTAQGISPQFVTVIDNSQTAVGVYEDQVEEEIIPEIPTPGANPQTGALPADLMGVTSLIALGTGLVLFKKKRKLDD
ncbi:MAG: DUF11 domain-containing protein [Clostridia bacterium]|nr:DUF11 domain-containing protein [Clostridia bacterium]